VFFQEIVSHVQYYNVVVSALKRDVIFDNKIY
jgi:hypothetical protein